MTAYWIDRNQSNSLQVLKLVSAVSDSYDLRSEICKHYIDTHAVLERLKRERDLREKNPALMDAYKKYQMLLQIVEK